MLRAAAVPRKKRDDTSVKVETAIIKKARVIVAVRDIDSLAEYLSDVLRTQVDRDYEAVKKNFSKEKSA